MAKNIYVHLIDHASKKEAERRRNLGRFLKPFHKKCERTGHIPFAFVGFLKKQAN